MSTSTGPARPRRYRTIRTVFALILREMATTYGRSPGGFIWAVAEPVAAIGLLSIAFSLAFRSPPLGQSFVLFYASGYLPFMLFIDVSLKVAGSLRFNKPLLAYPAVTYVDTLVARFFLNVLVQVMVSVVVLTAVLLIWEPRTSIEVHIFAHSMAMAAGLALAVGTMNCYLFMAFPLWENVWRIATRPLFIVSGIFFLLESIPRELQWVFVVNPLFHVTGEARRAVYPTYDATYVRPEFVWGLSAVLLALGLLLLRRNYRSLVSK